MKWILKSGKRYWKGFSNCSIPKYGEDIEGVIRYSTKEAAKSASLYIPVLCGVFKAVEHPDNK